MPIYDYACEGCGPFTAMRPMAQYRNPSACPQCGAGAPRTLVSAPGLASKDAVYSARTATEPKAGGPHRTPTTHPAGCGCCMRRWPLPTGLSGRGGRVFTAHGPVRRS